MSGVARFLRREPSLAAAAAASLQAAALFARLLVVAVLFELAQDAALLELHVEALESAIDRFVGLNGDVNQALMPRGGALWHEKGDPCQPSVIVRNR